MAWQATSKTKIIKYQAYTLNTDSITSTTLSQLIDQQMQSVEDNFPDLIPIIEADLATLDTLDSALTTEGGSTNSALIQAAELKWSDTRSKTSGISARFEEIRSRIAVLLSQSIVSQPAVSGGWGSGTLDRG